MEKRGADGHPLRSVTAAAAATHRRAAAAAREELAGWGFGGGTIHPRVASWSRRRGGHQKLKLFMPYKIGCCLFQCQTLVGREKHDCGGRSSACSAGCISEFIYWFISHGIAFTGLFAGLSHGTSSSFFFCNGRSMRGCARIWLCLFVHG